MVAQAQRAMYFNSRPTAVRHVCPGLISPAAGLRSSRGAGLGRKLPRKSMVSIKQEGVPHPGRDETRLERFYRAAVKAVLIFARPVLRMGAPGEGGDKWSSRLHRSGLGGEGLGGSNNIKINTH